MSLHRQCCCSIRAQPWSHETGLHECIASDEMAPRVEVSVVCGNWFSFELDASSRQLPSSVGPALQQGDRKLCQKTV